MMKQTVLAMAVLASTATAALAADSVDVRVIGTIVPASCTPSLSGGGTVDYGTIKADSLNATGYTSLPEKQLDFSITCDAPAKVAIQGVNGRAGSMAGVTESANTTGTVPVAIFGMSNVGGVGLGMDGSAKIGGYSIRIDKATAVADGNAVDVISVTGGGQPWAKPADSSLLFSPVWSRRVSWSNPGSLAPVAFTTMTGKLGVQGYINQRSQLDLTKPVHLDGLTTIELIYL
ncbi:DUF1120 domain-containing protein [Erwinia aphidicola]|uniref:DUF1120 domain-containing protein n=1 Tax=Erwinia aphidicola TaxID=68334 RepID=UPI00300C09AD